MSTDRIIGKIKKLLALASDPGAAPNEAATASRQAAALMAKHNLDLESLTQAELEAEWDITEQQMPGCRPGKKNPSKVPPWIGFLAFGVKLYTRTRASHRGPYVIYKGARQDVELAQWMLKALIDLAYSRSKGQEDPNAYRNGFASAVQHRLKAMVQERDQVEREAGALVVVDKLRAKLDELYGPELRGRQPSVKSSASGYADGTKCSLPTGRPIPQKGTYKALPAA